MTLGGEKITGHASGDFHRLNFDFFFQNLLTTNDYYNQNKQLKHNSNTTQTNNYDVYGRYYSNDWFSIEGIGRKRKTSLLRYFGSLDQISKASSQDLKKVQGIGKKIADLIYYSLN